MKMPHLVPNLIRENKYIPGSLIIRNYPSTGKPNHGWPPNTLPWIFMKPPVRSTILFHSLEEMRKGVSEWGIPITTPKGIYPIAKLKGTTSHLAAHTTWSKIYQPLQP